MFNPPIVTTTTLLAARYVQAISPHRNYIPQIVILSGTTLRVTPALFPPPTYIMLTTPLTPSSTSSFHPFALFPSISASPSRNETKRNETEGKRTISNDKRRKKRRRIVCRPRGTTSFSLRDTCLRTSIDFRFPSVDLSSFDRCLCSHGTPRRKGN